MIPIFKSHLQPNHRHLIFAKSPSLPDPLEASQHDAPQHGAELLRPGLARPCVPQACLRAPVPRQAASMSGRLNEHRQMPAGR